MAFKNLTDDQSDDNFYVSSNFYLPKSSVGLLINAKTEVHEQSPREAEVLFKAKHMPKPQQICVCKDDEFFHEQDQVLLLRAVN